MNRTQALTVLAMISDRNAYFKALDLTSQLTQLNSLNKLLDTVDFVKQRRPELLECVRKRKMIIQMSIDALCVLESEEWLLLLEGWNSIVDPEISIVGEPLVAKVPTLVV